MNDKISKQKMYTDFSVRLNKLEYKLDKVLALMEKPIPKILVNLKGEVEYLDKPPQWLNESYVDYMKRLGELNTAQSDEESFREECK